ncbi:MAG: DUF86 domain-containing protein [bacterium]
MLDSDVLEAKIDIIDRNLNFLKDYSGVSEAQFLESYKDVQAAKFSLLECIEACMDIANHIIASRRLRRPEGYAEAFEILGSEGIIDRKLADGLGDMARFRNLLVHRYGEVDNKRVLSIVQENLGDIESFLESVSKL